MGWWSTSLVIPFIIQTRSPYSNDAIVVGNILHLILVLLQENVWSPMKKDPRIDCFVPELI